MAAMFLLVAVPLAILAPARGDAGPAVLALYVALYAVTSRVEFDVGPGYGSATQLVLIPMLYALNPAWVPLLCAAAGSSARRRRSHRQRHPDRTVVAIADAWHAVAPALVFTVAGSGNRRGTTFRSCSSRWRRISRPTSWPSPCASGCAWVKFLACRCVCSGRSTSSTCA